MTLLLRTRAFLAIFAGAACFFSLAVAPLPAAAQRVADEALPHGMMLTWQRDPTTTMTVVWHTDVPSDPASIPAVEARRLGGGTWLTYFGTTAPFPHTDRAHHWVELRGLDPGADYEFRLIGTQSVYRFRTLPARLDRPVRIAAGGDTMHDRAHWEKTNRVVAQHDPDLILIGGDIWYENGNPAAVGRVLNWFEAARDTLVTADGRMIPILAAIGNHEVAGGYGKTPAEAPFYYAMFPLPGPQGYGVIDIGNYLSVFLLNTNHTAPIEGAQAEWLQRTMELRQARPHLIPLYHVPAYPSVRAFTGGNSARVREHWVPLFERYGVRVALENHDHVYKRTHRLRAGEIDPGRGILYVGDGAWGVSVRVPREDWYLAETAAVRHFVLITLDGDRQSMRAIDEDGNVIDEFESRGR